MKAILSFVLHCSIAFAAFTARYTITVDAGTTATKTDWPLMFCVNGTSGTKCDASLGDLTQTGFKVTGSGGYVTDAQGDDIVFTTDSTCATFTSLDWEVERYTGSTGNLVAWIRIPSYTTSAYIFYACVGDATITTFQGDVAGTWASFFKRVYHLPNGTTLSAVDSTGAANGTIVSDPQTPLPIEGIVDGGFSNQSINGYITASDTGLPSGNGDRTLSVWYQRRQVTPSTGYAWCLGNFATANQCFCLTFRNSNTTVDLFDGSLRSFAFTAAVGDWHYIVVTWKAATTTGEIFVDGASVGTWVNASQNTTLTGTYYIGETNPAVFNTPVDAYLDEHQITNTVLSADWILDSYNNQFSPSTYYTISAPVNPAAGASVIGGRVGRLL